MSYAAANDSSDSSFHPSLWLQRRAMALLILKDFGIERVLDLGCGEGALLQVLLNGQFSKLAGLDVDAQCLAEAAINCRPSRHDLTYLRDSPCRLDLYLGSLAHGVDQRCLGFQAIAALEVIEHLHPPDLEAFPKTVFGGYRPQLVIISTPNAEFNHLFENLRYGTPESEFRHWDHKFEWTRNEFQQWCSKIAGDYGYSVCFSGVGLLQTKDPGGIKYGPCSQFAIFVNNDWRNVTPTSSSPTNLSLPSYSSSSSYSPSPSSDLQYTHKCTIEMPFYNEPDLDDVKKLQEIKDAIYSLRIETFSESSLSYPQQDEGETEHHIIQLRFDLERLWGKLRVRQVCKTREALVQLLRQSQISDTTNTALSPAPPEFQFLDSARLDEFHLQHQQSSFPLCLYRESPRSEPTETVWLPWARAVNPPKGMILVQANFSIPRYVPPRMDDDEEEEEEEEEDDVWDRERNEGDNYEDDDYYSREYQNDFHVHEQQ